MNLCENTWNGVNAKLISKNVSIQRNLAESMLQNSEPIRNNQVLTIKFMMEYAEILYGIRTDAMKPLFWEVVFNSICERFKNITISDIQNSFRFATIEKKQYVSLTRDEVLQPIIEYWNKKKILMLEIERIEIKKREEMESFEQNQNFKKACKIKYLESLKAGTWLGDEFEAHTIAQNFKDVLSTELKNEIWNRAKKEHFDRTEASKENIFALVPGANYIYARMIIEKCIEKGKLFIEN
jgi:hypothetical protein